MFPTQVPYKLMVSQQMVIRNTNRHEKHKDAEIDEQGKAVVTTQQNQPSSRSFIQASQKRESLWNLFSSFFYIQQEKIQSLDFSRCFCKKTAGAVNKTTSSHLLILDSLWGLGESLSLKLVTSLINYCWVDAVLICKSKEKMMKLCH